CSAPGISPASAAPASRAESGAASWIFTFSSSRVLKASRTVRTTASVIPSLPTCWIGLRWCACERRWARCFGVRAMMESVVERADVSVPEGDPELTRGEDDVAVQRDALQLPHRVLQRHGPDGVPLQRDHRAEVPRGDAPRRRRPETEREVAVE